MLVKYARKSKYFILLLIDACTKLCTTSPINVNVTFSRDSLSSVTIKDFRVYVIVVFIHFPSAVTNAPKLNITTTWSGTQVVSSFVGEIVNFSNWQVFPAKYILTYTIMYLL